MAFIYWWSILLFVFVTVSLDGDMKLNLYKKDMIA